MIDEILPPGFHITHDGPNREVLTDDRNDEYAWVFATEREAADTAWAWWRGLVQSTHVNRAVRGRYRRTRLARVA